MLLEFFIIRELKDGAYKIVCTSLQVRWKKSVATCALYFRVHLCINYLIAVLLSTFDGTLALGCAVSVTTVGKI